MDARERQAVLLAVVERLGAHGSWCGQTHIQKAVYFLQELLGVPLQFDFVLYKHGPYSFALADELAAMRADGTLRMVAQAYPYGPSLLAGGNAGLLKSTYGRKAECFAYAVDFVAHKLGKKNAVELEKLATAMYVTAEMGHTGADERAARLVQHKPHVNKSDALAAVIEVDALASEASAIKSQAVR